MEETLATEKAKAAQQVQHGASGSSVEVAQIRKEVESERNRFKKALAELRRRNEVYVFLAWMAFCPRFNSNNFCICIGICAG